MIGQNFYKKYTGKVIDRDQVAIPGILAIKGTPMEQSEW